MRQIGLKEEAAVVDLTGSQAMVESLTETKVMCTEEEKVKLWNQAIWEGVRGKEREGGKPNMWRLIIILFPLLRIHSSITFFFAILEGLSFLSIPSVACSVYATCSKYSNWCPFPCMLICSKGNGWKISTGKNSLVRVPHFGLKGSHRIEEFWVPPIFRGFEY